MESQTSIQTKLTSNSPEYDYMFKIVLLGNQSVGKSQFLERFIENNYSEEYKETIGVEFSTRVLSYKNKRVKFVIWDTAGYERYRDIITAYLRGTTLAIIFVDQNESPKNKATQIRYWEKIIEKWGTGKAKIAIIETKNDVPGAIPLTNDELKDLQVNPVFHQTFSAKTADGLSTFINNLNLIIQNLIEANYSNDESHRLSTPELKLQTLHHSVLPDTLNINNISDDQAKMILHSIKEILIHGPLNETNKSYDFSIFGGGKPVMAKNGIAYTVPEHVNRWIDLMLLVENNVSGSNYHRDFLSQLFVFIKNGAQHKRFSRSSTTQDFYENCLPSLINHCVTSTPENEHLSYFTVRGKIDQFDENAAYTLLQQIKSKLEIGPSYIDKTTPYQIGFFGGKKCTTQHGKTIKVPDHVASILDYINRDIRPTTYQEKLLTVYHYLVIARHSKCSSRNESTESFYNSLPIFVADEINKINTQLKPPTL